MIPQEIISKNSQYSKFKKISLLILEEIFSP